MFKLKAAHQKALQATMRVALCGTLAACGGSKSSSRADTTPRPGVTAPAPTGTPAAKPAPAAAKADPTSEAECRTALAAAYPAGDKNWYMASGTPRTATDVSDAALAACCQHYADALPTPDYRNLGCCSATQMESKDMHCTPWGPPMPPAMFA